MFINGKRAFITNESPLCNVLENGNNHSLYMDAGAAAFDGQLSFTEPLRSKLV